VIAGESARSRPPAAARVLQAVPGRERFHIVMTHPDRRFSVLVALLAPAVRLLTRSRLGAPCPSHCSGRGGWARCAGGGLYGLVVAFLAGLPAFQVQLGQSFSQIRDWLARSPLRSSWS
jgi:hypothetical protein